MKFRTYVESIDIFGFERKKAEEENIPPEMPLRQFDVESMMEFLAEKHIGMYGPRLKFMNEVQWGQQAGAVKLEVGPRMNFTIKKLGFDLAGAPRWLTKKYFQLNRSGHGGTEDMVSSEIYEEIQKISATPLESAQKEYELGRLTEKVANHMRRVAKTVFVFEGVKKLDDANYLIVFQLRGHGVEGRDHQQIAENLTQLTFDKELGTIRITNYKVSGKVGGDHEWRIQPSDLDLFFFPSQSVEEISEAVATFFRYY